MDTQIMCVRLAGLTGLFGHGGKQPLGGSLGMRLSQFPCPELSQFRELLIRLLAQVLSTISCPPINGS